MGLSDTIKNAIGKLASGNRGTTGGHAGGSTGGKTGGSASAGITSKIRSFLNRR
ncbi:hypothetical protein [Arthrobacter sp. HLT1-21]